MAETFRGRWRITVKGRQASFDQRFVITGSDTSDGTYPGVVGSPEIIVDGAAGWQVQIQHNDGSGWKDSLMRQANQVVNGASLQLDIESEDWTDMDWTDLVLAMEKVGPIITIPIRPYAIETISLQMMPDGIFESALGGYFMGVRVMNIWGKPFKEGQYIEVTRQSRVLLAAQNIRIIDTWSQAELQSFNQQLYETGVVIGALEPFQSRTIYFKIDCGGAMPHKPTVEFVCREPNPMPDPDSSRRKASYTIYVTRSYIDPVNHEMVAEAPEGRIRMALREAIVDTISARKGRRRRKKPPAPTQATGELQSILKKLKTGRFQDLCQLHKLLHCYCNCLDLLRVDDDPTKPKDPRFEYDPFLVLPTKFTYTLQCTPYEGVHSPLPFQDPWWKVLLLVIAIVLLIAGMISEGADLAYQDEDLIIGSLEEWQRHDIDAALTRLNDHRTLPIPFLQYLDAQNGEVSTIPVEPVGAPTLGGVVSLPGEVMTKQEIIDILAFGTRDDKRVFKTGARTGLTHALIDGLSPWSDARDDGTMFTIDQVHFARDPDNNMPISRKGDSGSVWIHKNSMKLVALNHSGSKDESGNSAWGSLIEDIVSKLGIRFS
ncbi:MAG: hypothetical protein ACFFFC_04040 [Candidatus Thorarchaeota archaeon]